MLVYGRWLSPDTPASSTTKSDRHDIAEILLKVALNTNQNVNNDNIHIITRQSKISFCLKKVTINMITTLSVIIRVADSFSFRCCDFVFFFSILSVPDEGYSRNASCALNCLSSSGVVHAESYQWPWVVYSGKIVPFGFL